MFGPEQYVKTTSEPDTFFASEGEGTIIVKNGTGEGQHRIVGALNSAKVTVNGKQIFGLADFSVDVDLLESTVVLTVSQALTVLKTM